MNSGQIYLVTANVRSQLVIRFVVCSRLTEEADVRFAWNEIQRQADAVSGTVAVVVVATAADASAEVTTDVWPDKMEHHVAVKSLTQG
jgi:hypothetical protein